MTIALTTIDAATITPISHREARDLAEEAYRRFAELLATVSDDEWDLPTDCVGWTVRDMAGHVVGAMRAAASVREQVRQQREFKRRAKADGGSEVDHMTALQIELAADLSPADLVTECRSLVSPAARGRNRTPLPARKLARFHVEMGSINESWTLGYLVDIILTRDTWMHRVDLSRALGREMRLDAHDHRIVADVVAEWARRHGQPFELVLVGPAGARFTAGDGAGADTIELDPVEFCRIVSGRSTGHGLLATEVPF